MQVLRVKATRAVRAFAEAIPDIDEVDARNLQRCCDLLMIHDDRVPPDRQQAEAYDICREVGSRLSGGAAEDNTNYSDAMR